MRVLRVIPILAQKEEKEKNQTQKDEKEEEKRGTEQNGSVTKKDISPETKEEEMKLSSLTTDNLNLLRETSAVESSFDHGTSVSSGLKGKKSSEINHFKRWAKLEVEFIASAEYLYMSNSLKLLLAVL